jgi:hypothetical protein
MQSQKHIQSNLSTTATLGTLKLRPLLTGGRCSEVGYTIHFVIGPSIWWPLWAGGRYSEVVVSSGLTLLCFFGPFRLRLKSNFTKTFEYCNG